MVGSPSPEVIAELRGFDSPTISIVVAAFGVRDSTEGYASSELRCQFPDLEPMVGYAVTCTADTTTPGPKRPNRLYDLLDALEAAPKPAVVVAQDVGPERLRGCFCGDIMGAAFQKLGAVGMVTDSGVRDLSGLRRRAPGFQLFASGVVVAAGNFTVVEVGVPVAVCGLKVRPGDLLHGDENGLLSIPLEIAGLLPERARFVRDVEARMFDYLRAGQLSSEELKQRFRELIALSASLDPYSRSGAT